MKSSNANAGTKVTLALVVLTSLAGCFPYESVGEKLERMRAENIARGECAKKCRPYHVSWAQPGQCTCDMTRKDMP